MIEMMKIEEAIGRPLAHDITEIRPGEFKGPAFQKGHILRDQDLDHLRRLGKNHLYILKTEQEEMHEDDAAREIANALCGPGVGWDGEPREGKITLKATIDGRLKVDVEALTLFNMQGDVMCATRHSGALVKRGVQVAATRAIPLVIPAIRVDEAVKAAKTSETGVLSVAPIRRVKAGVMITGNEIYHGVIEDKFESVIRDKVTALGGEVLEVNFLPDDDDMIAAAALNLIEKGADVLITTGGMSVDPDDRTRFALLKAGAQDMIYGSAVLPGAMFMISYLKDTPVLGIPACGIYAAATVFDLVYPRVLTGEKITRKEIAAYGHGGLCMNCKVCRFPHCPFGK